MNVAAVLFREAPDLEGIYARLSQLPGLGEVALTNEYAVSYTHLTLPTKA